MGHHTNDDIIAPWWEDDEQGRVEVCDGCVAHECELTFENCICDCHTTVYHD